MANQPARRTPKTHSGAASKTVVNKIASVTQKISVKDIRFNMWKLLCSVLYYYTKITFRYLYTNSIPNLLSKHWYVKINKYDFLDTKEKIESYLISILPLYHLLFYQQWRLFFLFCHILFLLIQFAQWPLFLQLYSPSLQVVEWWLG